MSDEGRGHRAGGGGGERREEGVPERAPASSCPASASEMTRAAATGVPNSAPSVAASASGTHSSPGARRARACGAEPEHERDVGGDDRVLRAEAGPAGQHQRGRDAAAPAAGTAAAARSRARRSPGRGPRDRAPSRRRDPPRMPVAVSMTIIQSEEYPPMPSASGRSVHSTSWSFSASSLTPRNSRLHADAHDERGDEQRQQGPCRGGSPRGAACCVGAHGHTISGRKRHNTRSEVPLAPDGREAARWDPRRRKARTGRRAARTPTKTGRGPEP